MRPVLLLVVVAVLVSVACAQVDVDGNSSTGSEIGGSPRRPVFAKKYWIDMMRAKMECLREELDARGWKEVKPKSYWGRGGWDLMWTFSLKNLATANENQFVNHFTNAEEMGTKNGLLRNLRRLVAEHPEYADLVEQIVPRAYIVDAAAVAHLLGRPLAYEPGVSTPIRNEWAALIADWARTSPDPPAVASDGVTLQRLLDQLPEEKRAAWSALARFVAQRKNAAEDGAAVAPNPQPVGVCVGQECNPTAPEFATAPPQPWIDGPDMMWIIKPGRGTRGVDIGLAKTPDEAANFMLATATDNNEWVVQRYIERPLLIVPALLQPGTMAQSLKFDFRQFVLVSSLQPLTVWMHELCYLRFCSTPYDTRSADRFVHLTNHQVQIDSPSYETTGIADNQWSLASFRAYLQLVAARNPDYDPTVDMWEAVVRPRIANAIALVMRAWPDRVQHHRARSFELVGMDIMLTEHLLPQVLEINTNPGLHMLTDVVREHHAAVVAGTVKTIIDNRHLWESASTGSEAVELINAESQRGGADPFGGFRLLLRE